MKNGDIPIITTLLDNDWYQFKMAEFFRVTGRGQDQVTYKFFDRKNMGLMHIIDYGQLSEEIQNLASLKLGYLDSDFLVKNGISPETINEINRNIGKLRININHTIPSGDLGITYSGPIAYSVLFETPILAIVNEIYTSALLKTRFSADSDKYIMEEMKRRTRAKVAILKQNPSIKFVEFGTRRRFSRKHQEWVVGLLNHELKPHSFLGTSNVLISKDIQRKPKGTMAHQVPMHYAAKAWDPKNALNIESVKASQRQAFVDWAKVWPMYETFWLTDTFGSEWFLENEGSYQNMNLRQDSGNPFEIGDKMLKWFSENNRDPKLRSIMFSDSLNMTKILRLHDYFNGKCNDFYGWGTDLTNDGLIKPLSIVIKLFQVENVPTVKLGDGEGKEMGQLASYFKEKIFCRKVPRDVL